MTDDDDFEEKVANGEIVLLSIEQICERLNISRSTFIRIRSMDDPVVPNRMYFPLPDAIIGRRPRWTVVSLNNWIAKASDYTKRKII